MLRWRALPQPPSWDRVGKGIVATVLILVKHKGGSSVGVLFVRNDALHLGTLADGPTAPSIQGAAVLSVFLRLVWRGMVVVTLVSQTRVVRRVRAPATVVLPRVMFGGDGVDVLERGKARNVSVLRVHLIPVSWLGLLLFAVVKVVGPLMVVNLLLMTIRRSALASRPGMM